MKYNSQRKQLIITEYGRNIQTMVDKIMIIEDREERNKMARYVIAVMGQLNPQLRDINDYKHKLWDHLYIMSDFKIDVDSPYPIPVKENFESKPEKVNYPSMLIKYKHYGKIIEKLIDKAKDHEDGPIKEAITGSIAYHLKKSYLTWNRDSVDDDVILKDLATLSNNKLSLSEANKLPASNEIALPQNYSQQPGKKFNKNKQKQKQFKRKFGSSNSY
jgi:hypothetical protein